MIIVQARMGSERLPGKVLLPVLGRPLLFYLTDRLKKVSLADEVTIATTINPRDDEIISYCDENNIPTFRGSEHDVLDRYYQLAKAADVDVVVRITSDCPLIDPEIVNQTITYYLDHHYDYVSNVMVRTYPRGMDTEVFSFQALKAAAIGADENEEREHVTLYIYRHPGEFKLGGIEGAEDYSQYRLTVDTPEDFELVKKIIEELYPKKPNFTLRDIIELLQQHPNWAMINAHIKQKMVNKETEE